MAMGRETKREDLDTIIIRAEVDGKWGSYSLKELLDSGNAAKALEWGMEQIRRRGIGLAEGEEIKEKHLMNMINLMRFVNVVLIRNGRLEEQDGE